MLMKSLMRLLPSFRLLPAMLLALALAFGFTSCVRAPCDEEQSKRVELLTKNLPTLMEKADTDAYDSRKDDCNREIANLDKAIEVATATKRNKEMAEAYKKIKSQTATFCDTWKAKVKVSKAFAKESAESVRAALKKAHEAEKEKCSKKK